MKLRQDSPDRLVIEASPLRTGGALGALCAVFAAGLVLSLMRGDALGAVLALVCLIVTGALLIWITEWSRLTLDRGDGTATLIRRRLTGATRRSFALADLSSIDVEAEEDSQRLTLRLVSGAQVPVTGYFIGGSVARDCARAIERWRAGA